jgi:hypothetical protein
MPTSQPSTPNGTRRAVTSVTTYQDAEHAVDWLSDHQFPVEHLSIVGTGLRYVERVSGPLTTGRAAFVGAGQGALIALFWGLLFGLLFTTNDASFWSVVGFSLLAGAFFGALIGAISHFMTNGRRDFDSSAETRADHYEVQVDDGYAAEAQRLLATMPAS